MVKRLRYRRLIIVCVLLFSAFFVIIQNNHNSQISDSKTKIKVEASSHFNKNTELALDVLEKLNIKGRASNKEYSREEFGKDWNTIGGCNTRNIILNRDLDNVVVDEKCNVASGTLQDPYTGKTISFKRGSDTSSDVQIDHVVALSDAWQKGAQNLTSEKRTELANDPLELLAVDGDANQKKGSGDAATWLPANKSFRCEYVARQIAVKQKYSLWVTQAEYDAINRILDKCPKQLLPSV